MIFSSRTVHSSIYFPSQGRAVATDPTLWCSPLIIPYSRRLDLCMYASMRWPYLCVIMAATMASSMIGTCITATGTAAGNCSRCRMGFVRAFTAISTPTRPVRQRKLRDTLPAIDALNKPLKSNGMFRAQDVLFPCSTVRPSPVTRMHSSTSEALTTAPTYQFQPFDPSAEEETIFALSSGGGGSAGGATAVSVIRLTGPHAHDALRALLVKPGQSLGNVKMPKARMASLRTLWDPTSCGINIFDSGDTNGEDASKRYNPDQLDSALILTFAAPRSFTGKTSSRSTATDPVPSSAESWTPYHTPP